MGAPHELKLKPRQLNPMNSRQKSKHNDGAAKKNKPELPRGFREAAQAATKAGQMVMVLDGPHLKTRWEKVNKK